MASKKKTRKKTTPKSNNNKTDKRAKFEELGAKRTTKAVKAIRQIGNLSNRSNYDYTQAHVDQIMSALKQEVVTVQRRFEEKEKTEAGGFAFE